MLQSYIRLPSPKQSLSLKSIDTFEELSLNLTAIVQNANNVLVVRQKPQTGAWFLSLVLIVSLACIVYFWRTRHHLGVNVSRIVLISALLLLPLTTLSETYILTVNGNSHILCWSAIRFGEEVSRTSLSASDLSSAEMESSRGDRRIVVILRDGSPVYPLGDGYVTGQDDQYVVVNAIRNLIAGRPVSGAN